MKTNKSFTKRIRVTKRGKLLARKPGLNHFNAKMSRNAEMKKKKSQVISLTSKAVQRFLPKK